MSKSEKLHEIMGNILGSVSFKIFANLKGLGYNIHYNDKNSKSLTILQDGQLTELRNFLEPTHFCTLNTPHGSSLQQICINKSKPRVEADDTALNSFFD